MTTKLTESKVKLIGLALVSSVEGTLYSPSKMPPGILSEPPWKSILPRPPREDNILREALIPAPRVCKRGQQKEAPYLFTQAVG